MKDNRALLVYFEADIEKNRWFIDRLTEKASERGIRLDLVTPWQAFDETEAAFVINRSRDEELSRYFEGLGIKSFNNSETVRIGNDKLEEYYLFQELGLPVMETVPGDTPEDEIPFSAPYIVKHRRGHGGNRVFKARRYEEVREIIRGLNSSEWIIQKMCDTPGQDMRIYVLGGKIVASVLRTSKNDFRSNFSLGGEASLIEPPEEAVRMALKLSDYLLSDYIGVDLIRDHGKWIVNEVEDAAGARMLYSLTDLDIAEMYMCHICEKSSQKL
ncbi:MAG: ATP-grasp domain-containing protein [Lachnospiraceae bacterium]|nr:ATP-grasp domain-containing protein [Lachnospiraceae bacterium]